MSLILLDAQGRVIGHDASAEALASVLGEPVQQGALLMAPLSRRASAGDTDAQVLLGGLQLVLGGWQAEFSHRWPLLGGWIRLRALQPATPVRAVLTLDRSEFVLAEADRQRNRLEDLVVSRTVQLAEATERAESARRAKGAFLAHTSHQIRTPLNAIVALAHLMQQGGAADPRQHDRVRAVETSVRHLSAIVDDLLEMARADGGPPPAAGRPLALATLLDEAVLMLQPQAEGRGLQLVAAPLAANGDEVLRGDATRLRQAMLHAGSWALAASAAGTVRLQALLGARIGGRTRLRFQVDTGTPLAAPVDADASLAALGRLLQPMAGRAGLREVAGGGSRCWFTVLLESAAVATAPAAGAQPAPPLAGPADSASTALALLRQRHLGARVLVAEDDEINRVAMAELLAAAGLVADTVADGVEAVELATANDYVAIVLDLRMPRLDWVSTARAIRDLPRQHGTPLLAISANDFIEDRMACVAAGINEFLPKPVNVPQLYALLLEWLNRGAGAAAPWPAAAPPPGPTPAPRVAHIPAAAAAAAAMPGPPKAQASPVAPAAPDPALRPLLGVEGLDATSGLAAVGGNVKVYCRLLTLFADQHGNDGDTLRQQVQAGDTAPACAAAHQLRGSAATLGLVDIETAAADLELALEGGPAEQPLPALVQVVEQALVGSLRRVREALQA